MSDKRFSVVFTGKVAKGADPKAVLRNLASLLKIDDPKRVRALFKGPGAVVVKGITEEKANRYVQGIIKAGAMCVVREMPVTASAEDKPVAPVSVAPVSAAPVSAVPPALVPTTLVSPERMEEMKVAGGDGPRSQTKADSVPGTF